MLTLLTTTGCRQKPWSICEKLMANQTYDGLVRWVIVDDGEEAQAVTFNKQNWSLEIVRPSHRWKQGANTQQKNLIAGLNQISNKELLIIIEDDDYYHPEYLETVAKWLKGETLVGESATRYYNIHSKKYKQLSNFFHASLCTTALKGSAIDFLKAICITHKTLIDINLWKMYKGSKRLYRSELVIGMKGVGGRKGIGIGHNKDFQGKIDEDGSILKQWLKNDTAFYE